MQTSQSSGKTVLVSGGSGHLAGWVIVDLLRRGFRVRATLRNLARESELRARFAKEVPVEDRLLFHKADLLADDGWDDAVRGVEHVIHMASPMGTGKPREDLLTPAVQGTRRVLEAAARAGVSRVVVTSSAVAALPPLGEDGRIVESNWTERPDTMAHHYKRAKTLAEREAWDVARRTGLSLTTILPGFIQGPVLGEDVSGSLEVVRLMLRGKLSASPRIGFSIVDVRDLATLHVDAMLSPRTAGERLLAAGDFLWFSDIAGVLRERMGDEAAKVSTRTMPDVLVRLFALFSPQLAQLAPDLGLSQPVDPAKANTLLGWKSRPAADSIVDGARSLLERRLV